MVFSRGLVTAEQCESTYTSSIDDLTGAARSIQIDAINIFLLLILNAKAKIVFGSMPHTALQRLHGVQFHNPVELCQLRFGLQISHLRFRFDSRRPAVHLSAALPSNPVLLPDCGSPSIDCTGALNRSALP
jgi:hypothetical protein